MRTWLPPSPHTDWTLQTRNIQGVTKVMSDRKGAYFWGHFRGGLFSKKFSKNASSPF